MKRNLKAWAGSIFVIAFAGIFGSTQAQGAAWRSKPLQQWSKFDAEQVLNDSAWVAKQEVRIKQAEKSSAAGGAPVPAADEGGYLPTVSNTIDVGSARPPVDFVFKLRHQIRFTDSRRAIARKTT